jgi:fructuronate reductase
LIEQIISSRQPLLLRETVPGLPADIGIDVGAYVERCFDRLANTAIRHTNHQIAIDGSQKIVQRLLNPIRACIARGIGHELLAAAVAAWMAYLLAASKRFGARWVPDDPWAEAVRRIADETGPDAAALARRIVALEPIFAADLAVDAAFRARLARHLGGLLLGDPRRHLEALLAEAVAA